ncbi:MAG: hypothetical protein ACO307_03465 [Ilumatobacteraceae bacterium]
MTDDRPVFEIELSGPDGRPDVRHEAASRPARSAASTWFAVGGVAAVIAIFAVIIADSSDETSTPIAATTVPVLPTLPPPDDIAARPDPSGTDPSGNSTSRTSTVYKSIEPPRAALSGGQIVELESPRHTTGFTVGSFVFSERSVDALDDDLPRRSTTDHVVGIDGFRQRVVVTNDPSTGRYRIDLALRLDGRTTTASILIDLLTDTVWLPVRDDEWTTLSGRELARRVGVDSLADYLRRLQLGPLRSDTRPEWSSGRSIGLVEYPGEDDPLAEWIITVDAGEVPFWSRYALGPLAEAAPLPDSTPVDFSAYVTSTGVLRRVTAETEFGATTERIDHLVVVLDEPVVIDIPAPDAERRGPDAPDTTDQL